jgi:hypothetical protein
LRRRIEIVSWSLPVKRNRHREERVYTYTYNIITRIKARNVCIGAIQGQGCNEGTVRQKA